MINYSVTARDRGALPPRTFMLRAPRQKRHVRLGEEFLVSAAGDGLRAEIIARCSYRATAHLTEQGLVRVLNPRFTPDGDGLFQLFQACEQGSAQADAHLQRLAKLDGYDSWADLVRAHAAQGGVDEHGRVVREVIGWLPA